MAQVALTPEAFELLKDIDKTRKDLEKVMRKIKKALATMDSIRGDAAALEKAWARVRAMYSEAMGLTEKKERLLHAALVSLDGLLEVAVHGPDVAASRKRKRDNDKQGPMQVGQKIICRDDDAGEWILGRIKAAKGYEYKVMDEDPDAAGRVLTVAPENALPLPGRTDLEEDTPVLALWEGSTCFYPGHVMLFHKRGTNAGKYAIRFDGDLEVDGRRIKKYVAAEYVVERPDS